MVTGSAIGLIASGKIKTSWNILNALGQVQQLGVISTLSRETKETRSVIP